jgi:NAD(P)-dependent dehydrogenase (short-subunit alcohol dehydrogenase family)
MQRFADQVALVQGGSSGMGRAVALALGAAGANVVVSARRADACESIAAQIREAGGRALAIAVDVTDETSVGQQFDRIEQQHGRLDLAFNNVGATLGASPTHETPLARLRESLEVNLVGLFASLRREIPLMLRAGGGGIVNNSSIGGVRGFAGIADYCAAKWGVIGLTKSAALEYAAQGLRINAIAPGLIETERFHEARTRFGAAIDARLAEIPLGQPGGMQDVAGTVLWLLSRDAAFVSGAVIPVDGGESARRA